MSNYPPPPGYPPQPQGYAQPQQPAQPSGSTWVDNRQVIGGFSAQAHGMQVGKHIEYKVYQKPTQKGGTFKTVEFFKPYQKRNGTMGQSHDFSLNQMKELVERINHFQNTYCEEKGYFIWQPAAPSYGVGQPAQIPMAPVYATPPTVAPQYAPQAYPTAPAYPPGYGPGPTAAPANPPPPPPGAGGPPWP